VAVMEPDNYEARAALLWAGTLAHNNTVGAGRLPDFASHAIEHELSALYDVAHGAGLAVVFPAWMTYVMEGNITRFAQYAVRVWNCGMDFENPRHTALQGIARTRAFFHIIGMPLTFAEIGAREEDIPLLTGKCKADAQGLLGNFRRLTREDVAGIYRLCL
jgi:alcohol dehydrogenase YqhD (iron-dependent ADH family)